jgi:dihydropteroate synthase
MNQATMFELQCGSYRLTWGKRPLIMGIVNVTPDSFSDGGNFFSKDTAVAHGKQMEASGADIIDIGGESTRPFSDSVPLEEELRRVIPVIESLAPVLSIPISIDTNKAEVARQALAAGATMVNDIGALRLDPDMGKVVATSGVPVVLMHMKGTPKDMQSDPDYSDVVAEVKQFLSEAIDRAEKAGVRRSQIIIDPGIGFGKTVSHNLLLIKHLSTLNTLGVPVLIGPSRKSFITKILGDHDTCREIGTQAVAAAASLQNVHIVRVHDVQSTVYTLDLIEAIKSAH